MFDNFECELYTCQNPDQDRSVDTIRLYIDPPAEIEPRLTTFIFILLEVNSYKIAFDFFLSDM